MQSAPQAPTEAAPAFLVGAERSGTTLLRLMLDHHPQLAWNFEFEFVVDPVADPERLPSAGEFARCVESDRIFEDSHFAIDASLDYRALVRSFLAQRRERDAKPFVGATVHRHFDRLPRLWPEARYVHLIRDPRDVALSCVRMGWAGNVWSGAQRWVAAEEAWDRLVAGLPRERWIELHYEQLVLEPEAQLARLCAFLGLSFDAAMLEYPEHSSYPQADPQRASRWAERLSRRQVAWVEARVGSRLASRGYAAAVEGEDRGPGRLEQVRLRVQDRLARIRFRLGRYGPRLVLGGFMARRLGLRSLERRTEREMNAIDRRHLA